MLNSGSDGYVWDARNQLASMNAGADSFQYDPFGRRVAKTASGATTNYLYDFSNPVQELSGTTPTANLLIGLGVNEHFTRTDSAGERNFLTDPLGSTVALTDSTGAIQTQYTYEPFGNTTASSSPSTNPYQFTGRENDATGLYFYRARYYSPVFGRFLSQDPIGCPRKTNLYAYVGDAPTRFVDPFVLSRKDPMGLPPGPPSAGGPPGATPPSASGPPPPNQPDPDRNGNCAGRAWTGFRNCMILIWGAGTFTEDLAIFGCLGTAELAPACIAIVEAAYAGPLGVGTWACVHNLRQELSACGTGAASSEPSGP